MMENEQSVSQVMACCFLSQKWRRPPKVPNASDYEKQIQTAAFCCTQVDCLGPSPPLVLDVSLMYKVLKSLIQISSPFTIIYEDL